MATRLRKDQTERTRLAIKTTQIIHRLQKFVDGEVEMTSAQIRAAELLLKKTVPDLSSVEMVAEIEDKRFAVSDKPMSENEWESRYSGDLEPPGGAAESTH